MSRPPRSSDPHPPCAEAPYLRFDQVMRWSDPLPVRVLWSLHHPATGEVLAHDQAPTMELAEHRAAEAARTWLDGDHGPDPDAA